MDDISWSTPRPTTARHRTSCAVCGLRAEGLVCEICALRPKTSIAWLERLPRDERVVMALDVLRELTAVVATCSDCHTTFEDINGHGLCDTCLVDRVNGAGELELD